MDITGGADRFLKLLSQTDDSSVQILQILYCVHRIILFSKHKLIISQRLNFEIIIKIHNFPDFRVRDSPQHSLKQFSRLTGRSDNQPFPILLQNALGNPGNPVKIVDVGPGHQPVQIHSSDIIFSQKNNMVRRQFSNRLRVQITELI